MTLFPVILCGGSGARLWPASRGDRPKQFINFAGDLSLFQETVRRVSPLAADGRILVVAGQDHLAAIEEQLGDTPAVILVEPSGRDSGPAIAAAAAWIAREDPKGLALFVASDHHIPDGRSFQSAVRKAAEGGAAGRIVTFGVRPTEPSSAYGYIQPEGTGLAPVKAFVEKPDRATAQAYMQAGYLWNSGNFLARVDVLLDELDAWAPEVSAVARRALPDFVDGRLARLDPGFAEAPRISIDYAVMERSTKVSVLPVSFGWSDLGAWDAVAAAGATNRGLWVGGDGDEANLVWAAEGMVVATAGVSDLAIVAEPDAVLVCHLSRSQEVKGLVERLRALSPGHVRSGSSTAASLGGQASAFDRWMRFNALPVWATLGVDADGGFREAIDRDGVPSAAFRRARVQARQAWVYSVAGMAGWDGPWRDLVARGLDRFEETNRRSDGLYRTRVSASGEVLDDAASLYDQAFALFAFAAAAQAGVEPDRMRTRAHGVRTALEALAHSSGGWIEPCGPTFQANAHMHLLEACLAWEALEPEGPWSAMADAIVALARGAFIDPEGGFLREFFDADWRPAAGEEGRLVEPGHQFEWAWLLTRWGRARDDGSARLVAERLYEVGLRGIDAARGVAIDELDDRLEVRSARARLWPQTERLKAAAILAETPGGPASTDHVAAALKGLSLYLEPTGLWRDKQESTGGFVEEPAPASSLYHITSAWVQLRDSGLI